MQVQIILKYIWDLGSILTRRVIAGIEFPQMNAIMDCFEVSDKYNMPIIADYGIQYRGDITKLLLQEDLFTRLVQYLMIVKNLLEK